MELKKRRDCLLFFDFNGAIFKIAILHTQQHRKKLKILLAQVDATRDNTEKTNHVHHNAPQLKRALLASTKLMVAMTTDSFY